MLLSDPITRLPFIGKSYAFKLQNLGVQTVQDLLYFFPYKYHDARLITPINLLEEKDKKYSIFATVDSIKNIRTRSRMTIQKAQVHDETGAIAITWFNQPFLINTLKEGTKAYFSGKLNPRAIIPEFISPLYDVETSQQVNAARIVPVYPLTAGLPSKWLRRRIFELISLLDSVEDFSDTLPENIKEEYYLLSLKDALMQIHFPDSKELLVNARRRLSFDELLDIQTKLIKKKRELQDIKVKAWKTSSFDSTFIKNHINFKLTETQKKAMKEISQDIESGHLMNRLIQGDVGSGKTLVAFYSAEQCINNGHQAVILAPTSVLAQQHYQLALKLFDPETKIGLITSSTTKKIKNPPKLDLIIGTHAILFHKSKLINDLGLLVVDEEHRFGVEQRNNLMEFYKKSAKTLPHYISMTATPIPRSIALSLFGDMDVSIIKKPVERKPVKTFLVPASKRNDSISWIKKEISAGNQVFWICPLIEDNPDLEAQSVKLMYESLIKIFPKKSVRLLHGKIKAEEKNKIISDFKEGKFMILVSTTVIEVGIDIPSANLIVIENAERFGLAQLHQLRGRVGRSEKEAWCLMFAGSACDEYAIKRLNFFASETDGNKIAEFDLQMRGPGEVYGNIQSGIPSLKIARFSNQELLLQTREVALQFS